MHAYMAPVIERKQTPLMLRQVPVKYLKETWPYVHGLVQSVTDRSEGRWPVRFIAEKLARAQWQLWVVYDGQYRAIVGTELFEEPNKAKHARIVFCTGLGAKSWTPLIAEIEAWAKDNGCVKLEMLARKGWARHLEDYKITHVMLEKAL